MQVSRSQIKPMNPRGQTIRRLREQVNSPKDCGRGLYCAGYKKGEGMNARLWAITVLLVGVGWFCLTPANAASKHKGNAAAEFNLGLSYQEGHGVPQSYAKAVYWFRKAALQGDARAEFNLGLFYAVGQGGPRNYAKAVYWLRKAALQGNALGETGLGLSYQEGHGVPQNYAKAVYWFRKAALQGDAFGEDNLGMSYALGQGVPRDDIKAAYWYHKAAMQGGRVGKMAQKALRALEKPTSTKTTNHQGNAAYLECLQNQKIAILLGQPPATCIP